MPRLTPTTAYEWYCILNTWNSWFKWNSELKTFQKGNKILSLSETKINSSYEHFKTFSVSRIFKTYKSTDYKSIEKHKT